MEFDFHSVENNYFAALYESKGKLKVDLLRFSLVDNIARSRKPFRRVILFKTDRTRKRVEEENRSVF